ncbi:quinone-dependent dihydroorotate dehydrogenase [Flavobacteriaceae bacterium F08102]|nr:quinone-dependent dihydroorotate dehydrogenase [Flavobacteriaceae bacterium F08102]
MYTYFIRKILFLFDPERVHYFTFSFLKASFKIPFVRTIINKVYAVDEPSVSKELFGLHFKNPVGLAAGFDKNAMLFDELSYLGFGFVEIGTVTPKPQDGNPKKRLFRLKKDQGIINRMGFNNDGVDVVVERLKKRKTNVLIGGNIGKNKITPNEKAVDDYLICFHKLFDWVDYFVINVSSPNTPNLRDLQEKEPLTNLLNRLQEENATKSKRKPILLKIAPDLTDEQLLDIIEIVETTQIDGVIATNTTVSRKNLTSSHRTEMGGLSGKPLTVRSTEVIRFLSTHAKRKFPIIGVGGIHSAQDAKDKLDAGADLIQLYTGFIYEGPGLVKRINTLLAKGN